MGASSATPTGPSAPAIVGSADTRKMTHGTAARRPPTRFAAQSTMRSAVPFVTATPKRYVTPTSSTNRSAGKPAYMSSRLSPWKIDPTMNVITSATAPRFTDRVVPTTKTSG
jgi:hypothetical protein